MEKHLKYLNILEKIAESVEPIQSSRVASCIVYKNEIIAIGTNQRKTHPMQAKYTDDQRCIFLHAEMAAIINANRRLDIEDFKHATIYVLRVKFDGPRKKKINWGISKPCSACHKAIEAFSLKKTIFIDKDGSYAIA